ncbi:MAG TPA: alpha/beta hydrolase [Porphyromonadaceae bacterium]|nr:alpha/beta hydrolase [Porphyromonadaceae bacterium]
MNKMNSFLRKTRYFVVAFAENSWRGAAAGAVVAMIFVLFILGSYFKTGVSPILDVFLILLIMGLLIFGTAALAKPLFKIVKSFNPSFVAAFIATYVVAGYLPYRFFSRPFILFGLVCGAIVGYSVSRGLRKRSSRLLLLFVVVMNGLLFYFLSTDGFESDIVPNDRSLKATIPQAFDDPSKAGKENVKELFYGSGDDKNRPEYGSLISIKTESVDATPFFDQSSGFANYARKAYWGFNSKNYPINARVWYPDGKGPFPLVLIVHGNHSMIDYSDPGYEYLGRLMASRGYIVASVDENFLNGGWMGDYEQKEMFTRAWLLLKHLENWRKWNETKNNPFYERVDMNNIALIGHSRGGAAVVTAAAINQLDRYHLDAQQKFDFNFSIKGIVQIAPNDPYTPQKEVAIIPENINYLILQGGHDEDMHWFLGNRVYNRVIFKDGNYHFKTALYIYRANHGQFNTSWGRKDNGIPASWFLNTKPIMSGEEQREIAKVYISAFLESTLKGNTDYIPLFKDFRQAAGILPKDFYISQFEDTNFTYIADFQEDFDVTTTSLQGGRIEGENLKAWREDALPLRDDWGTSQQNSGVCLGWEKNDSVATALPQYVIHIPDSTVKKDRHNNLFFFICNNKDEEANSIDFSMELTAKNGSVTKSFGSFRQLPPPLKTKLTKTNRIYSMAKNKPVERVLQYVEIPFSEFTKADSTFEPSEINQIRFVFDKTDSGEILLDKIGIN